MGDFEGGVDFSENQEAAGAPGKVKARGGGGKAILGLLKWIGIGLGFIILVFVIVAVSIRILGNQSRPLSDLPNAETMQRVSEAWAVYNGVEEIRSTVRGIKDTEQWMVVIKINLAFDGADKTIPKELSDRRWQIQDFLRSYISRLRIDELMADQEELLKVDIRDRLNNQIFSRPFIKDIYFENFQRTQM
ncbi:MAG: hypothetical protein A2087_13575 [Spirochaetes bacterium GWD1_61_31]|nr:MAG: hypothetical protein A2Y37_14285 [Spirochaetes bacterium GWB1_60_80]OHD28523.1 MAG: hypothetical protein A2004_02645 [Spirochaetes bacterium GWC1_61_12]OHD42185.1 MAG: hypothetical protein A2087_13575 [Spirochaetes bacterium GWD1_61_31]OHD44515.1 MAG: hypothetical protein A2Y35_05125 [Spirochaetes bacterium GWE1_60_18]OHD59333.1 MAG: hypothetical protein A2Y32_08370 [Spirochaetes bacterium GWF1_60_12]HAP43170.1 hypothetical protein [Spirochaetaceae bacterium]